MHVPSSLAFHRATLKSWEWAKNFNCIVIVGLWNVFMHLTVESLQWLSSMLIVLLCEFSQMLSLIIPLQL